MLAMHDIVNAFSAHGRTERQDVQTGPLAGLTFAVKDLFDVAGIPSGCGNPDWLRTHPVPQADAAAVAMIFAVGARFLGKTHTDELAWSLNGQNAHYGTPLNVAAPGRIPGGSSSGSAAATAAQLVDFAIGSDTGGSVRIPASYCGLYGMRVTHGRVSLEGAMPFAPSYDAAGWFAREPGLFGRIGHALMAPDTAPSPRKLLIAQDFFDLLGPAQRTALGPAIARMETHFGKADHVTVAGPQIADWRDAFRTIQAAEIWQTLGTWVSQNNPVFGPGIRERFAAAPGVTAEAHHDAKRVRATIKARMDSLLADGAALLLPTAPDIAPLTTTPESALESFRAAALSLLCPAGHAGLPQISLPFATLEDCPFGISLMGAAGSDLALLDLAAAV
jgi:amidase